MNKESLFCSSWIVHLKIINKLHITCQRMHSKTKPCLRTQQQLHTKTALIAKNDQWLWQSLSALTSLELMLTKPNDVKCTSGLRALYHYTPSFIPIPSPLWLPSTFTPIPNFVVSLPLSCPFPNQSFFHFPSPSPICLPLSLPFPTPSHFNFPSPSPLLPFTSPNINLNELTILQWIRIIFNIISKNKLVWIINNIFYLLKMYNNLLSLHCCVNSAQGPLREPVLRRVWSQDLHDAATYRPTVRPVRWVTACRLVFSLRSMHHIASSSTMPLGGCCARAVMVV